MSRDAIPLADDSPKKVVDLNKLDLRDEGPISFRLLRRGSKTAYLEFNDPSVRYEYHGHRADGIRVTLSDLSTIFTGKGEDTYSCKSQVLGRLIGDISSLVGGKIRKVNYGP